LYIFNFWFVKMYLPSQIQNNTTIIQFHLPMYVLYEVVVLSLTAEAQMHNAKLSGKLKSKLTAERLNKEIRKIKMFRRITCKMSNVRRAFLMFILWYCLSLACVRITETADGVGIRIRIYPIKSLKIESLNILIFVNQINPSAPSVTIWVQLYCYVYNTIGEIRTEIFHVLHQIVCYLHFILVLFVSVYS